MNKYVVWNEPYWTEGVGGKVYSVEMKMSVGDAIAVWKQTHSKYPYTDERALEDFLVVHWGRIVEENT